MKEKFLDRFGKHIKGTITGFDRIIFKGILKPLIHENGFQNFLYNNNILNKGFKKEMEKNSEIISKSAEDYTKKQIDCKTIYINSSNIRKEDLVRKKQDELGIKTGLIGTWSCLESCYSYKGKYDEILGYPRIKKYQTRCKHIYDYLDDGNYGFMSIRLQTWAPYNIQIAINGREWLRRLLDKNGTAYLKEKNKFLELESFESAQKLLDSQLCTDWVPLLNSLLPTAFPDMKEIVGDMEYDWVLDQSEWAKDYIFESPEKIKEIMQDFLHYSFVSDSIENVFKYMNQSIPKTDYCSRVKKFDDGYCFKAYVNKNSVKFYNFLNVLRFELTMNNPKAYKVHRYKVNDLEDTEKKLRDLPKSVAFTKMRSEVSDNLLKNFINHVASTVQREPLDKLFSLVSKRIFKKGKRIRALDIMGKDKLLLKAISDVGVNVGYLSNKFLRKKLESTPWAKGMSGKRLSARVTRQLRILKDHGIIKKVQSQNRYYLTDIGRKITSALNITLGTSSNDLLKLAA